MANDLKIDKGRFDQFCREAWRFAENEGEMWHPINRLHRHHPFLIQLMLLIATYFEMPDPRLSSDQPYSFEFYNDYDGHMERLLEGRMEPIFDFRTPVNDYVRTAIDRFKLEDEEYLKPKVRKTRRRRR